MSIGEDSVRPSGAGLRNVHFLIMHTSIGYKLLTVSFGEYMSAGRFLCRGSSSQFQLRSVRFASMALL